MILFQHSITVSSVCMAIEQSRWIAELLLPGERCKPETKHFVPKALQVGAQGALQMCLVSTTAVLWLLQLKGAVWLCDSTLSKFYSNFEIFGVSSSLLFEETRILEEMTFNKQQTIVYHASSFKNYVGYPHNQDPCCQLRRLLLAPTACTWQTSTVAPSFFSSLSQIICLWDRRSLGPFTSTSYKEMWMISQVPVEELKDY